MSIKSGTPSNYQELVANMNIHSTQLLNHMPVEARISEFISNQKGSNANTEGSGSIMTYVTAED